MGAEAKLAELGITVPEVVPPVAAYQPTARTGNLVFTASQLPARDGEMIAVGKVGGDVSAEQAYECARQCALNALAAVKAEIGSLDSVVRVVKAVVFVASTPDFTGQPKVANGASELLGEVFGDAGKHARSAVGVSVLPLDVPVEVEIVVEVSSGGIAVANATDASNRVNIMPNSLGNENAPDWGAAPKKRR